MWFALPVVLAALGIEAMNFEAAKSASLIARPQPSIQLPSVLESAAARRSARQQTIETMRMRSSSYFLLKVHTILLCYRALLAVIVPYALAVPAVNVASAIK